MRFQASASGSRSSCLKHVMLECNCMVLAGGKYFVINVLQQLFQDVMAPLGCAKSHSFGFPLREKGNKRNLSASGSISLIRIISQSSVKVCKWLPASSEAEPPNWFC